MSIIKTEIKSEADSDEELEASEQSWESSSESESYDDYIPQIKIKKEKPQKKKRPRYDSPSCPREDSSADEPRRPPRKKLAQVKQEDSHPAGLIPSVPDIKQEEMEEDLLIVAEDPADAIRSFYVPWEFNFKLEEIVRAEILSSNIENSEEESLEP